jgi:ABC-type transport system involved in cytochrome bd biosynthesis fused ATPase/permease subunit
VVRFDIEYDNAHYTAEDLLQTKMEVYALNDITVPLPFPSALDGCFGTHRLNFQVKFKPGERTALVGSSGSGKTAMLQAIIGQMRFMNQRTSVKLFGNIAYVPQEALSYLCSYSNVFQAVN